MNDMKKIAYILLTTIVWAGSCSTARQNGASTVSNDSAGSRISEYKAFAKNSKPTAYRGYKLVWNDEFDVDGKPGSHWTPENGFVRNKELQWYQAGNATVSGGCMVIEGRAERVRNPLYVEGSSDWRTSREYAEFTSASMTTRESFHFKYGRLEVRAKIPTATGSWPAIWTLGNMWDWPMNGEIDLMEFYIRNGVPSVLANACWSSPHKWTAVWDESLTPFVHFTSKDAGWADKFHLWRMDWDSSYIRLYLDGELLNEIDLKKTQNQGYQGNTVNPFSNDVEGNGQYILLNLALGGNGGTPDVSKFPLRYYIDFVRVYQKTE